MDTRRRETKFIALQGNVIKFYQFVCFIPYTHSNGSTYFRFFMLHTIVIIWQTNDAELSIFRIKGGIFSSHSLFIYRFICSIAFDQPVCQSVLLSTLNGLNGGVIFIPGLRIGLADTYWSIVANKKESIKLYTNACKPCACGVCAMIAVGQLIDCAGNRSRLCAEPKRCIA